MQNWSLLSQHDEVIIKARSYIDVILKVFAPRFSIGVFRYQIWHPVYYGPAGRPARLHGDIAKVRQCQIYIGTSGSEVYFESYSCYGIYYKLMIWTISKNNIRQLVLTSHRLGLASNPLFRLKIT